MKKAQRSRFEYRPRDKVAVQKRASQSGGLFDSVFRSDFAVWRPKDGGNRIRFLPPTWDKAEHFGLDLYVHYGIGSDSQSYLCLEKMKGETCPICEEKRKADKAGDTEYSRELSPTKRVLVWMLDRDDEESGPQLWSMPWTVDRDFAALSIDKRTREILFLDSPEEGYDVEFTKSGSKLKTKYIGAKIDRKPSPLTDDEDLLAEWTQFIGDNPLSEVLQYFDAGHIAEVAAGKKASGEDDEDEDDRPTRSRQRASTGGGKKTSRSDDEEDDDEEEAPKKKVKRSEPDEDEDDEDEDEDEVIADGRGNHGVKKTVAKGKAARKAVDEDEDDDDDDEEVLRRPAKAKSKPVRDEDDEVEAPKKPVRSVVGPARRARAEDDEDEEFDCVACSDTGRNSKGGYCVCAKGKKMKVKDVDEEDEEDDE